MERKQTIFIIICLIIACIPYIILLQKSSFPFIGNKAVAQKGGKTILRHKKPHEESLDPDIKEVVKKPIDNKGIIVEPVIENPANIVEETRNPPVKEDDTPKQPTPQPTLMEKIETPQSTTVIDHSSKAINTHSSTSHSATTLTISGSTDVFFQKFPECRVYSVNVEADIKETFEKIDSLSSLAAFYDEDGAKFNLLQAKAGKDVRYNMIVWDGFVNIKKAGTYTFMFTWVVPNHAHLTNLGSIGLQVKDQKVLCNNFRENSTSQGQLDVELEAGWNKLRLCVVTEYNMPSLRPSSPVIHYKLRNVIGDPRELKPAELTHKVDEVDW